MEDDKDDASSDHPCSQVCCYSFEIYSRSMYYALCEFVKRHRRLVFALVGGQVLALLLCGTGTTSEVLEQFYSISAPTSQLFFMYLLLSLVFGPLIICRKDFLVVLKDNWWKYLMLGIIDVEANYLVVLAYKYTNMTSIQILDSFTIAAVLVLSYVFLRARYLIIHMMGVALCVVGIGSLILVDFDSPHNEAGPHPLIGDLLCLAGATLYAISNVSQEYLVKNHSIIEWLGFLGTVGSVVSGIQLSVLERRNLASVVWNGPQCGSFALFVGCLFLFYTLMPLVMRYSSAVVVNLSLLTADVYTMIFGVFLFGQKFSFLYAVSFIIVVLGVFIFNLKPLPEVKPRVKLNEIASRLRRRVKKTESPEPKSSGGTEDSTLLNSLDKKKKDPEKFRHNAGPGRPPGSLIRGPLEPKLSSMSYSTVYSESMSYSYGSNSKEGSEILKRLNSPERGGVVSNNDNESETK